MYSTIIKYNILKLQFMGGVYQGLGEGLSSFPMMNKNLEIYIAKLAG
jgi:hypothetical protein